MKRKQFVFLSIISFFLVLICAPSEVMAVDRVVDSDTNNTCDSTATPPCYRTITAALTASSSGDLITVEPGLYTEKIILKNNVSIYGRETARTILSGGGSGTVITADSITTATTVKNLTIISATTGMAVTNSTLLRVYNNVFESATSAAIQTSNSASTEITNNTFYNNGRAISTTDLTLSIMNNVFSGNDTAISPNTVASSGILNNLFFNNGTIGPTIDTTTTGIKNIVGQDPLFVPDATNTDITKRDFHLQLDALGTNPCIDAGNTGAGNDSVDGSPADIGTYGGPNADTIPFPVTVSTPTVSGTGPYTVNLSWSQNLSYMVTNTDPAKRGGYKIYYSLNHPFPPYTGTDANKAATTGIVEGDSPVNAGYSTTGSLSGLSAATAPAAPTITSVGFASQTLKITWTPVAGATSYTIYYIDNDAPTPTEQHTLPLPSYPTSFDLTGLVNLHQYSLAVTASAQNILYVAVTAYDSTAQTKDPGVQHESAYSEPKLAYIGNQVPSAKVYDPNTYFPEAITPNPNLPNKGCFIATAAYGHYSAPQVQALRDFRDEYLLTNKPGRAFVRWYYEHGPVAAQFITDHPWLKPVVRTALLPAVGGALFMTRTSGLEKTVVLSIMMVGIGYFLYRRKLLRTGGRQ